MWKEFPLLLTALVTALAGFIQGIFGGTWVKCTKDIGMGNCRPALATSTLPGKRQAFNLPQPFASWSFNEDQWQWEPPVPRPADNKPYVWNEDNKAWEVLA